jgi:D-alanyl-D-alanine carboxypeptidase/D-alanyl-D-alanine-endopeptidase (penicillin-binding protein 4)
MLRRGALAGLLACLVALAVAPSPSALAPSALAPSALGAAPAAKQRSAASQLSTALGRALWSPHVDGRRTAAFAVDLRTGEVAFQRNASLPLIPASVEKLTAAFTALRQLGTGYRFHTDVVGRGQLIGQTWKGDLYLVGSGDPTLGVADVGRLARDVKAAGIRRVTGSVIADEHRFDARRVAPGWKPSFLGIESPPLSALAVNDLPVPASDSSAAVAAGALTAALKRRNVVVARAPRTGLAPAQGERIAVDHSARLGVVVLEMNLHSDNFVAEMLLKELGAAVLGRGTTNAGARVVRATLAEAGVPLEGLRVVDGSGLSRLDRMTTRSLVVLLRVASRDPDLGGDFVSSLPVAGLSGTLRDRLAKRPTRGRVVAKTGTTSRACSLAGFVRNRYAFAILQNGSPVSYWFARLAQDRFVQVLARR